jgi:hypothetical protein
MSNKLKIITTVSAWPEALAYQNALLKKFCEDEFDFIAIIDTDDAPHYSNLWSKNARKFAIDLANSYCDSVIEFPKSLHNYRSKLFPNTNESYGNSPPLRTADTCQFAWLHLKEIGAERAILIDSDMFPISNFSFSQMSKSLPVGAVAQDRGDNNEKIRYF